MEQINGQWVISFLDTSITSKSEKLSVHPYSGNKDEICAPSDCSVVMKENNGQDSISAVPLRRCEKDLQPTGSEKADCISITPSNKRNKQRNANGDAKSLRPSRRSNEEALSDATLSPETCKQIVKQTEVLDWGTSVDLDTSTPDHQGNSSLKQSGDRNQPSISTENKGDRKKHPIKRKRGRAWKLRVVRAETVDQTPTRIELVKPLGQVVLGLSHDGHLIGSKAKSSGSLSKVETKATGDEGKQLVASADHESVVSELRKEGEVTNLKRKRGRPPKVLSRLGSPKTNGSVPGSVENKRQDVDVEGFIEKLFLADEVENPVAVVEPVSITPNDQFEQLDNIRRLSFGKRSTAKRQVRKNLKSIKLAELPTKGNFADAADSSSGRAAEGPDNGVGRDVAVVAVTSTNASDDDKPLSAWLEGTHPPPSETDARLSLSGSAGQFVETGVKGYKIETPAFSKSKEVQEQKDKTSAGNSSCDNGATKRPDETLIQSTAIVPRENQELPFVKNSLIWGVIESMDVLKRIPQKPHFLPLYNSKVECREGLAIGSMVTFTSLAERISRTRFDDPKSLLDGYLEALVDLEELGFNVGPVQELLHKLISIKSRYEEAQNTSKEIESQIMERTHEKTKISDEIAELEKKIMELKEKQAVVVSNKERKEAEIILLQLSLDAEKVALGTAQEEFEKVTASHW